MLPMIPVHVHGSFGYKWTSDIMEMCPSLGRATIENALKKLVEDGSLIHHSGGRSTYYTRNDTE